MTSLAQAPASAAPSAPPIETLADLIERLGGVPPHRIRFRPAPSTAVEQDVLEAAKQGLLCELVDGVLVEKAMGYSESLLAALLIEVLNGFVRARNLGHVTAPDATFRLFPGLIRIPDVAFTSWDRMPNRRRPAAPMPDLAPDLAVEVLSQSNTPGEMARKRRDYFASGVLLIWMADPAARTVDVYTSETQFTRLTEADGLDGGGVLPGFRLSLHDWFAELDRHG